jgi:hypothetical protein
MQLASHWQPPPAPMACPEFRVNDAKPCQPSPVHTIPASSTFGGSVWIQVRHSLEEDEFSTYQFVYSSGKLGIKGKQEEPGVSRYG